MRDTEEFVKACADPNDTVPRMVFADYLEESSIDSNVALANFIRKQIQETDELIAKGVSPENADTQTQPSRESLRKNDWGKIFFGNEECPPSIVYSKGFPKKIHGITRDKISMLPVWLEACPSIKEVGAIIFEGGRAGCIPELRGVEKLELCYDLAADGSQYYRLPNSIGNNLAFAGLMEFSLDLRTDPQSLLGSFEFLSHQPDSSLRYMQWRVEDTQLIATRTREQMQEVKTHQEMLKKVREKEQRHAAPLSPLTAPNVLDIALGRSGPDTGAPG